MHLFIYQSFILSSLAGPIDFNILFLCIDINLYKSLVRQSDLRIFDLTALFPYGIISVPKRTGVFI